MRKMLFLTCLLGLTCVSSAQNNQAWANLETLKPGQKIQIVEINAKEHSGTFVSLSETAISFDDAAGAQTVPRQDVRKIKINQNKRLRNTLIGAGIGAGAGAGITAAAWEPHGFLGGRGVGAAVGAIIGGLSGAVVGAVLPSHGTIYNAGPH